MRQEGIPEWTRGMLRGRGLIGSFWLVESTMARSASLTVVFAIQSRLNDVVKLENERTRCCEEPIVAADVLDIRPYNTVSSGRFGGGSAPY